MSVDEKVNEFLELGSTLESIDAIKSLSNEMSVGVSVFGFEVDGPDYPYPSLDLSFSGDRKVERRVFVHPTFDWQVQQNGESLLEEAGLFSLDALLTSPYFTFRSVPLSARRLLLHHLTEPTSETLGRSFVVPIFKALYETHGAVPTETTLNNLVHVEELRREFGSDVLDTNPRFIPPYEFTFGVSPLDLVEVAASNSRGYGASVSSLVRDELSAVLESGELVAPEPSSE